MLEMALTARRGPLDLCVSLTLPGQQVGALFGASGAGKTTVLRWIAGLEPQLRGTLRVDGDLLEDSTTRVPAHRRRIAMVFQHGALFPHLDVAGNLAFAARRAGADDVWIRTLTRLVAIDDLLHKRIHQLSAGQVQRVALARALAIRPRLLLLDEPLANLDLAARDQLMAVLEQLHRELAVTTLLVSHQPQEVQRLGDHLFLLEHGRLSASGPLQQLLVDPSLPLAHLDEAAAVIEAHCAIGADGTALLAHFDGGSLVLPGLASDSALAPGAPVRVAIAARDVSIALTAATDSSISNILPARILDIGDDARDGQCLVRLRCGTQVLLARLTQASSARLDLKPGMHVHAQVKSVALLA